MTKETMMKILDNPTAYNSNERLTAARLALTFLDLLSVSDIKNEKIIKAAAEGCSAFNECNLKYKVCNGKQCNFYQCRTSGEIK